MCILCFNCILFTIYALNGCCTVVIIFACYVCILCFDCILFAIYALNGCCTVAVIFACSVLSIAHYHNVATSDTYGINGTAIICFCSMGDLVICATSTKLPVTFSILVPIACEVVSCLVICIRLTTTVYTKLGVSAVTVINESTLVGVIKHSNIICACKCLTIITISSFKCICRIVKSTMLMETLLVCVITASFASCLIFTYNCTEFVNALISIERLTLVTLC